MDDKQPDAAPSTADELAAAEAALQTAQQRLQEVKAKVAAQEDGTVVSQGGEDASSPRGGTGAPCPPEPIPVSVSDPGTGQPENAAPPQGAYYWQQPQQEAYYQQPLPHQAPPPNPYYQQPSAPPLVSPKDHVAAGLLAIFLGWLGIHKFYLGYNTAGFIMLAVSLAGGLVTLGLATAVMGLLSFIEGILYLAKSQTEFEQTYVLNKREWF